MTTTIKPAVLAVNYYTSIAELPAIAAGASNTVTCFDGQSAVTATTRNDLVDGILPDNRSGDITAIFWRNLSQGVAAASLNALVKSWEHIVNMPLALSVNNVEVIKGPLWAFSAPPTWVQGGSATAQDTFSIQNGGYMLMSISHTVGSRQRIRVTVGGKNTGTATTVANPFSVTLQVADKKPIV